MAQGCVTLDGAGYARSDQQNVPFMTAEIDASWRRGASSVTIFLTILSNFLTRIRSDVGAR